jgi:intraflagellar transport protein 80
MVSAKQWPEATRLCRMVKDLALWATLAAAASEAGDISTAEIAFAALNLVGASRAAGIATTRRSSSLPTNTDRQGRVFAAH